MVKESYGELFFTENSTNTFSKGNISDLLSQHYIIIYSQQNLLFFPSSTYARGSLFAGRRNGTRIPTIFVHLVHLSQSSRMLTWTVCCFTSLWRNSNESPQMWWPAGLHPAESDTCPEQLTEVRQYRINIWWPNVSTIVSKSVCKVTKDKRGIKNWPAGTSRSSALCLAGDDLSVNNTEVQPAGFGRNPAAF